jgi:hypothetical protein
MKNSSAVVDVLLKSKAKADCLNKVFLRFYSAICEVVIIRMCREENGLAKWLQILS